MTLRGIRICLLYVFTAWAVAPLVRAQTDDSVLRIVTSVPRASLIFRFINGLEDASRELLQLRVRVDVIEGVSERAIAEQAISVLRSDGADIAIVEMHAMGDAGVLGYALQPFFSRDVEGARKVDLSLRNDLRRILDQDRATTLLATLPQLPRVVLANASSWNGIFDGQLFAPTQTEVEGLVRIGLQAQRITLADLGSVLKVGRSFALAPLDMAVTASARTPWIYLYDLRSAYPALAVLSSKFETKGLSTDRRQALQVILDRLESVAWSSINTIADQLLHATKPPARIGEFQPGTSDNVAKLRLDTILGHSSKSISELMQREAVVKNAVIASTGEQQVYGKCRDLEILIVTNRALDAKSKVKEGELLPKHGEEFLAELSAVPYFAKAKTQVFARSFDPKQSMTECVDATGRRIPGRGFDLHGVRRLSRVELERTIASSSAGVVKDRPVFIFVHGYNVNFFSALETSARVSVGLDNRMTPLLISWPSVGGLTGVLAYRGDGERAEKSGDTIIEAIKIVGASGRKIQVVAHSMGNRAALIGLSSISQNRPKPGVLEELVTIAPDVECDQYLSMMRTIQGANALFARSTLYLYENDYALTGSQVYHFLKGTCRIGNQRGAKAVGIPKLEAVDWSCLTEVNDSHSYFVESAYIASDLREILATHSDPLRRRLEPIAVGNEGHYFLHPSFKNTRCRTQ